MPGLALPTLKSAASTADISSINPFIQQNNNICLLVCLNFEIIEVSLVHRWGLRITNACKFKNRGSCGIDTCDVGDLDSEKRWKIKRRSHIPIENSDKLWLYHINLLLDHLDFQGTTEIRLFCMLAQRENLVKLHRRSQFSWRKLLIDSFRVFHNLAQFGTIFNGNMWSTLDF